MPGFLGSPAEREQALLRRIDAFIECNLGDPELTPRVVADHHHISLRSLYSRFEGRHEGVAASIRRRRLERCRAELGRADPRRQTVQAIAARWGFTNASGFSRAFRAVHGLSPREYRASALHSAPRADRSS